MRLFALVVLVVGCGRPMPATLSDGCYNVGVALCDRRQACGVSGVSGDCRSAFVATCCAGVDCARPVKTCASGTSCCGNAACDVVAVDVGVFDRCENSVRQLTCGQLAAGLVPSGCIADAGTTDAGTDAGVVTADPLVRVEMTYLRNEQQGGFCPSTPSCVITRELDAGHAARVRTRYTGTLGSRCLSVDMDGGFRLDCRNVCTPGGNGCCAQPPGCGDTACAWDPPL